MFNHLYVRGLRVLEQAVICVGQDGQKTFFDPIAGRRVPYGSGQQSKRSVLDAMVAVLGEPRSPVTFNVKLTKKLEEQEPWSACDPTFADQLVGGWMRAKGTGKDEDGAVTIRRRGPLSLAAFRPLHPLLGSVTKDVATFDRRDSDGEFSVRVTDANGEIMDDAVVQAWLEANGRSLRNFKFIGELARANGLFVYDVQVDLDRLFLVSLDRYEPEIDLDMIERLEAAGWLRTQDDQHLVCPPERREAIARALAEALVHWRVTSNQSNALSLQATLAVFVARNASKLQVAAGARLSDEGDRPKAIPMIREVEGVESYLSPALEAHIANLPETDVDALDRAVDSLTSIILRDARVA